MGAMRLTRETFTLPRAIEPDVEIVAIGDIHGRSDLFGELLDAAATTRVQARTRRLVLLGDLVDRGPDSLGALALARGAGERIGAGETIGLFGNHEILMRMTLDREIPERAALRALQVWLSNGGDRVVEELFGFNADWSDLRELLLALRETVPSEVAGWLGALRANYRSGEVLFVHAGVNPTMPLEGFLAQDWDAPLAGLKEAAHWAWVRGPFLDHRPGERGFSGYFVVHGHTPLDRGHTRGHAEQVARFRLNLDGGSAVTGMAKMAVLRGGVAEVVSVMDEGAG
jgi:serine/threonine protein phosphatase 1